MSRKLLLTIAMLLIIIPVFSQDSQWWIGKPIEDIQFKNLKSISESELEPIVREYIGKEFTDSLSWDLQSKIFALDFFESYSIEAVEGSSGQATVVVIFTVEERPSVSDIEITGNRAIPDREILDVILLKKGDLVNRNKVRIDADAIQDLYLEKGFPSVSVSGSFEEPVDGESVVVFKVNEGTQNRVKEILFSGNSFGSSKSLKRLMDTKEQALFNSGIYQANVLEEDKQKILDYYWQRGYIDAAITDVNVSETYDEEDERTYLTITIYIDEGEQWTFGGIDFEGNTLFSDEELSRMIRQDEGDVVNKSTLEIDFSRVADVYYNDGYIYNSISREEFRDDNNNTISYTISFIERGRAHIENIIIRGNSKTKDYVIYRELPLEVGDIFSKDKIAEGIGNLYNLQYFSDIYPETPPGSADGLMDLILNVEEGKTIDLQFGISFAGGIEGFPIIGFIKWTDRNFLGRGQEISVGADASTLKQTITLGFTENWILNKRISAGVNLSYDHGLVNNEPQDILPPYGIKDPYTGVIVDENGNPVQNPDPALIGDEYDYDYNMLGTPSNEYAMSYDSHELTLSGNIGYIHHTNRFGRLGVGGGLSGSFNYISYDDNLFRPYNETVRDNLDAWQLITKNWLSLSWDSRQPIYNPLKGHLLSERVTFAGGVLPSTRDYIKSQLTAEGYFTLWDTVLFRDFPFIGVLGLHSSMRFVLPQFNGELNTTRSDLLFIDGMTTGRGWGFTSNRDDYYNGQSLWDNWVELRIPLAEQIIWMDIFFSSVLMKRIDDSDPIDTRYGLALFDDTKWNELEDVQNESWTDNMKYTIGAGVRFVIPGLPLGFYVTKRFRVQDGSVRWERGNTGGDVDFFLAITQAFY